MSNRVKSTYTLTSYPYVITSLVPDLAFQRLIFSLMTIEMFELLKRDENVENYLFLLFFAFAVFYGSNVLSQLNLSIIRFLLSYLKSSIRVSTIMEYDFTLRSLRLKGSQYTNGRSLPIAHAHANVFLHNAQHFRHYFHKIRGKNLTAGG